MEEEKDQENGDTLFKEWELSGEEEILLHDEIELTLYIVHIHAPVLQSSCCRCFIVLVGKTLITDCYTSLRREVAFGGWRPTDKRPFGIYSSGSHLIKLASYCDQ